MSGLSRSDIDDILRLIDNSNFDELRLEMGDLKIELRRRGASQTATVRTTPAPRPSRPGPAGREAVAEPAQPAAAPRPAHSTSPGAAPTHGGVDVPAPQLGIFYHAPRPGEPPFVSVGDEVHHDTVIGIIEVMKLMNTVEAGLSGTVTEIVAPNGEGVKMGDTLIRVRPFA